MARTQVKIQSFRPEPPTWQPVNKAPDTWMLLGKRVGQKTVEKKEKYDILNLRLLRELSALS